MFSPLQERSLVVREDGAMQRFGHVAPFQGAVLAHAASPMTVMSAFPSNFLRQSGADEANQRVVIKRLAKITNNAGG